MINEDLLLSRIDILENKLLCYQKNVTEEKLQNDVVKLQDDKTNYQVGLNTSETRFVHNLKAINTSKLLIFPL